jgi:hypothetical protein
MGNNIRNDARPPLADRRIHPRHAGGVRVYVKPPRGAGKLCVACNLSADGAFLETDDLGLTPGAWVELAFTVPDGRVTRLHRRRAVVTHVSKGGTGLRMQAFRPS